MKKIVALAATLSLLLFSSLALADGSDAANGLTTLWEGEGYPADVGGVFYDQDSGKCGVLLTEPTPEREAEILDLANLSANDVFFVQCAYSHKDMFVAQQQIVAGYMSDGKITGVGIGWLSDENGVSGFGESGFEMRVMVDVPEEYLDEMTALLTGVYGDMVYLEIGTAAALDETAQAPSPASNGEKPNVVLYVCIGLFFAATVTVFVFWLIRMKERHIDGK